MFGKWRHFERLCIFFIFWTKKLFLSPYRRMSKYRRNFLTKNYRRYCPRPCIEKSSNFQLFSICEGWNWLDVCEKQIEIISGQQIRNEIIHSESFLEQSGPLKMKMRIISNKIQKILKDFYELLKFWRKIEFPKSFFSHVQRKIIFNFLR